MCSNDTMGKRNILQTTNHQHSKYSEKFNNVEEGKKTGPEILYRRRHSYGSSAFELSRFHCMSCRKALTLSIKRWENPGWSRVSHLHNFTSRLIYLRIKCVNLCSNDTMGNRNILQTTNHQHSKYSEKFNNVEEGKKSGPEILYGRRHSYGSSAFELSRFHCMSCRKALTCFLSIHQTKPF